MVEMVRCRLCRVELGVEPGRFSGGIYVGFGRKRGFQDFWLVDNWKDSESPLIAMSKTGWNSF